MDMIVGNLNIEVLTTTKCKYDKFNCLKSEITFSSSGIYYTKDSNTYNSE